ncbi:galactokinase [Flavicella marina]|uniref:galactokinase n=1 Tax=Flavicella marina TaxID=1475951 RepID=UPI00126482E1|nr:galactokinase [Flavicella marina]
MSTKLSQSEYDNIDQIFAQADAEVLKIEAPGRINLIGEHIDYNGGNVLPAAIDKCIYYSFKKNGSDKTSNVLSKNFSEGFTFDISVPEKPGDGWLSYLSGVLSEIEKRVPGKVTGFDCALESKLPIGSGISSSAALLCGFAKGLNELFELGIDDIEIVKLCQNAERIFSGANVGVMDQFAVVKGKKDHFILLDCDTLEYKTIPAAMKSNVLLLLNTNVSHNLADSAYNERRAQCESALEIIQSKYPQVKTLVEATEEMVEEFKEELGEDRVKRATHVIQEQKRVEATVEALKNNDFELVGDLLNQSHDGLQNLYEVSCPELDFLAAYARKDDRVLGARMMGGGFGGCTINLIDEKNVDSFVADAAKAYKEACNLELTPIPVKTNNGVQKI